MIRWALLALGGARTACAQGVISFAEAISIFHVNEYSAGPVPINMNSANLLGDMYFEIRGRVEPLECADETQQTGMDCANAEVVSDDLVINQLELEIDSRFGDYGRCNVCVNGSAMGAGNCTDGQYSCACGGRNSSEPCGEWVGVENVSSTFAGHACKEGDPAWVCWRFAVAQKTGGLWYSTFKAGYCGGAGAADSCAWRVKSVVKVVNKTCSDESINSEVERADATGCFEACTESGIGPLRNTSSPCWIGCFFATVLGDEAGVPGGEIAGMPLEDLVAAWNRPFADVLDGGCPGLPVHAAP